MPMIMRATSLLLAAMLGTTSVSCHGGASAPGSGGGPTEEAAAPAIDDRPSILATNAFYYYDDLDAAWAFYTETLGLPTVSDFGFAKILRVAERSYLTLVAAEEGMHSTDEPKSVTLAVVTDEVEGWYTYLAGAGVPMRAELEPAEGRPHDGFVAIDPEGYLLEFERFNPHPENDLLLPVLSEVPPLGPTSRPATDQAASDAGSPGAGSPAVVPPAAASPRPDGLRIRATVLWLYFEDLERIERFYREMLGADVIVDQGWAKVIPASTSGFIGLVDGSRGLHRATERKAVTVSFITGHLDPWFERATQVEGFELRTPEITDESDRVRLFVGYDPEGYFLEWDEFLDLPGNEDLVGLLGLDPSREE